MMKWTRAVSLLVVSGLFGVACSGADGMGEFAPDENFESSADALTISEMQAKMNSLYDMNNVVKVNITMPASDWTTLRMEEPAGGRCNWDNPTNVDRFPWHKATSIKISGTSFLTGGQTFTSSGTADLVEVKKKSFCGSISSDKPSISVRFKGLTIGPAAENALGTKYLTFNNSIQDTSYIRQCLGYKLYGMAGLPRSRCNFVEVSVNGTRVTNGVYVNVEPVKERYIDNPQNGFTNKNGNLYEFEKDDFTPNRVQFVDVESSGWQSKTDLAVAAEHIRNDGLVTVKKVFNLDHFLKMYAMDFLLKHWDGFTVGLNNTFVYNDSPPVQEPDLTQIKFKLIPWGIDQILQSNQNFTISDNSVVGKLVSADPTLFAQLQSQIAIFRENVFSRTKLDGEIKTFTDLMLSKLSTMAGMSTNEKLLAGAEAGAVSKQLKIARSAAYILGPSLPTTGLYLYANQTYDALHASATEGVPPGSTNLEVTHEPRQNSSADRWLFTSSFLASYKISNEGTGRGLQSTTIATPAGHYYLYTSPNAPDNDYNISFGMPVATTEPAEITGLFTIQSFRTAQYLRAGTDDPTPGGKQRVYQIAGANNASAFFWY